MPAEPLIKRAVAFAGGQNLFHAAKEAFGYRHPTFDVLKLVGAITERHGWMLAATRFYTGVPAPSAERRLGYEPRDVSAERCCYDIESRLTPGGSLRFIEVKGWHKDGKTITVTRNEIRTALHKREDLSLAMVPVDGGATNEPRHLLRPFQKEPDFGVTSVNYALGELLAGAGRPL